MPPETTCHTWGGMPSSAVVALSSKRERHDGRRERSGDDVRAPLWRDAGAVPHDRAAHDDRQQRQHARRGDGEDARHEREGERGGHGIAATSDSTDG